MIAMMVPALQGALTMRIDTENNFFYLEGSDFGNAHFTSDPVDPNLSTYDLQFFHALSSEPSASASEAQRAHRL